MVRELDAGASDVAAQEALATFGTIDVLVANAAIRPDKPFLENTEADWRRVMGTNLESAIHLSQAFIPGMIAQKWGRIVYMTGRNASATERLRVVIFYVADLGTPFLDVVQ